MPDMPDMIYIICVKLRVIATSLETLPTEFSKFCLNHFFSARRFFKSAEKCQDFFQGRQYFLKNLCSGPRTDGPGETAYYSKCFKTLNIYLFSPTDRFTEKIEDRKWEAEIEILSVFKCVIVISMNRKLNSNVNQKMKVTLSIRREDFSILLTNQSG